MASVPNGNIDQTVTKNKQESQEQAVPLDQATREKTKVIIPAIGNIFYEFVGFYPMLS